VGLGKAGSDSTITCAVDGRISPLAGLGAPGHGNTPLICGVEYHARVSTMSGFSGPAAVAQSTSYSFLEVSAKLICSVCVAGAGSGMKVPCASVNNDGVCGCQSLHEGSDRALLPPCLCSFFRFSAWSCSLLCYA
jgi:hypothetical protein